MALASATVKNLLASSYGTAASSVALYTTVPCGTAGTEVTGTGYSRQTPTWSTPVNGVSTATVTFTVPVGVTVAGVGVYNSSATYLDGGAVTSQTFATSGSYVVTISYTQS